MNKLGCTDCKFFIREKEVCTSPKQPTGTDGYLHLVNWDKPNECGLYKKEKK